MSKSFTIFGPPHKFCRILISRLIWTHVIHAHKQKAHQIFMMQNSTAGTPLKNLFQSSYKIMFHVQSISKSQKNDQLHSGGNYIACACLKYSILQQRAEWRHLLLLEDNMRQPCLHRPENQFSNILKEMMRVTETPCLWVHTYKGAIHRANSKNSLELPKTTNQHKR